jgi:hypothetical protein
MTAETALLVFVLIDIFKAAFAPLESLPAKTVPILAAVSAFTLVIIVALSIVLPAGSVNHLFAFCRTYHRAAELVVCICLWAIVLYARSLGIAWRDQMIGIASGFLFYLTVQALTTSAIAMTTNAAAVTWMSRAGIVAYMASLVIWIRAIVCSATSHAGVGTWKAQRYEPGRG